MSWFETHLERDSEDALVRVRTSAWRPRYLHAHRNGRPVRAALADPLCPGVGRSAMSHERSCYAWAVKREVRVFASHEQAGCADLSERASMTKEQRLAVGALLHDYWVRNYHQNASRLDRTVRVTRRPSR